MRAFVAGDRRLDEETKAVGRRGVSRARLALAAHRPVDEPAPAKAAG